MIISIMINVIKSANPNHFVETLNMYATALMYQSFSIIKMICMIINRTQFILQRQY